METPFSSTFNLIWSSGNVLISKLQYQPKQIRGKVLVSAAVTVSRRQRQVNVCGLHLVFFGNIQNSKGSENLMKDTIAQGNQRAV